LRRLALVMIARDEARSIVRALSSARPFVDRMIVLDTGSSDGTQALAAGAGAQVFDFTWRDDFAAARNAALERSDADWNLILDADEWIEGDGAGLGAALLPAGEGGFLGQARVVSETGEAGAGRSWIPRVLPRGVRYHGRIHEQPVSPLPQVRLPLVIGHDGYLPANLERKGSRNETLLMAELEARPDDAYVWLQLAKEYQVREKPDQAAHCFAEALRLAPTDAPFRHPLVVRAITAFKTAQRFDEAMALANAEHANWKTSPDFFFALGDLYLAWAEVAPDRAMSDFLPLAEFAWKKCLEIGERDDLDGSVAGRGSHMPAHNLAAMYRLLGLAEQADEYDRLATKGAAEAV
jgi:glycosyltransferase involved in cell wall biosynthesis